MQPTALIINDTIFQKAMMLIKHLFDLIEYCLFRGHVGTLAHFWGIRPVVSQAESVLGEGAGPHLQDRSQEDGDSRQDEDNGAGHSLFPGREEHMVR